MRNNCSFTSAYSIKHTISPRHHHYSARPIPNPPNTLHPKSPIWNHPIRARSPITPPNHTQSSQSTPRACASCVAHRGARWWVHCARHGGVHWGVHVHGGVSPHATHTESHHPPTRAWVPCVYAVRVRPRSALRIACAIRGRARIRSATGAVRNVLCGMWLQCVYVVRVRGCTPPLHVSCVT